MKTLDEVIAVMDHVEFCCTNCELQFDCGEDECFLADALHYLKEYKIKRERIMAQAQACYDTEKRLQEEIARYQEAVKNCELAQNKYIKSKATYDEKFSDYISLRDAWAEQQENSPLTWQELQQMEGKPVWVEDSNGKGEWVLLSGTEDEYLYFVYRDCAEYKIYRDEQGIRWQAYRKERE